MGSVKTANADRSATLANPPPTPALFLSRSGIMCRSLPLLLSLRYTTTFLGQSPPGRYRRPKANKRDGKTTPRRGVFLRRIFRLFSFSRYRQRALLPRLLLTLDLNATLVTSHWRDFEFYEKTFNRLSNPGKNIIVFSYRRVFSRFLD